MRANVGFRLVFSYTNANYYSIKENTNKTIPLKKIQIRNANVFFLKKKRSTKFSDFCTNNLRKFVMQFRVDKTNDPRLK